MVSFDQLIKMVKHCSEFWTNVDATIRIHQTKAKAQQLTEGEPVVLYMLYSSSLFVHTHQPLMQKRDQICTRDSCLPSLSIRTHTHTYTHTHTCMWAHTHTHTHMWAHTHTHTHTYTHTHTHTQYTSDLILPHYWWSVILVRSSAVHTYTCLRMHICAHVYARTCMRTHTHTHTHTHANT